MKNRQPRLMKAEELVEELFELAALTTRYEWLHGSPALTEGVSQEDRVLLENPSVLKSRVAEVKQELQRRLATSSSTFDPAFPPS